MKKIFLAILSSIATTGLFADATLSVASVLPEALEVQIDGYAYFAGTNDITIPRIYSGYHRVVVYASTSQLFNQDLFLQDGVHTDITINRFGTALIDERPLAFHVIETLPMGDFEFSQALLAIKAEWPDGMVIAKQVIDLNYLSSDQVGQIMQLFDFDNERLQVAKYAYHKVIDLQNYYLLNKHFTFSSTKKDFDNFIRFNLKTAVGNA